MLGGSQLIAQPQEFEKIQTLLRQFPVNGSGTALDKHEVVWLELIVADSLIIDAVGYYSEQSVYKDRLQFFLKEKVKGFRLNVQMSGKVIVPLLLGTYTNKNYHAMMQYLTMLESLKTKNLNTIEGKDKIVVFPVSNVMGTYSPPHRVRSAIQ